MPSTTSKSPRVTFTAKQQAMRAHLAALTPSQFDALKAVLQQSAAAIDIRLSQLDAERDRLSGQKAKLSALIGELAKPAGLDHLRSTILKGERFSTPAQSGRKTPGTTPKKPKKPGR